DRAVRLELDGVLLPVRRVTGLGVVAAQPQSEFSHAWDPSVFPHFGLPARDRDRRVGQLRLAVLAARDIDVLQPLLVVAVGVVEAELRAARLLALDRRCDGRLRAVE